jgi:hypothetical protein
MKNTKAQANANNAAITLIVITVVLVLYILFLPPADRDAILSGNASSDGPSASRPLILLNENVGRLNFVSNAETNYNLQSFNLRTVTAAEVVASKSNLYVKNSLFDTIQDTFVFNIDPSATKDLVLTFNAQGKGRLEIELNNKRIFFGEIDGNSPPIYIDSRDLKSSNNLIFTVTSPGIIFWSYNSYDITNLRVVGDVTDFSRSSNTQTISLSERDMQFLDTARIRYIATCNQNEVKNFQLSVNHNSVFRGIPDCSIFNQISLSKEELYAGVNFFEFKLDEGQVTIDQARLILRMDLPENPLYYFDVEDRYFYSNETLRQNREVELKLRFPNTDRKRIDLFVNGRVMTVNVAESEFKRDISSYIVPGINSLEIRPLQTVDVTELRVELR